MAAKVLYIGGTVPQKGMPIFVEYLAGIGFGREDGAQIRPIQEEDLDLIQTPLLELHIADITPREERILVSIARACRVSAALYDRGADRTTAYQDALRTLGPLRVPMDSAK